MLTKTTVCLFMLACAIAVAGSTPSPMVTVPEFPSNIPQMREAISGLQPAILFLRCPDERRIPTQETKIWLAYDDTNFYTLFQCAEDKMESLHVQTTEQDGTVWQDDSVEIFLDTLNDGKTYFHVIANTAGVKYDKRDAPGSPSSWNGEWSVEISRDEGFWTAFFTIPFSSLGIKPKPGDVWGAQFHRNEIPHTESSHWAPTGNTAHRPALFGSLVFGTEDSLVAALSSHSATAPDRNPITFAISNPSSTKRPLHLKAEIDGKEIASCDGEAAPGLTNVTFEVDIPKLGIGMLSIALTEAVSGRPVARALCPVDIPDHRESLKRYRRLLGSIKPISESGREQKVQVETLLTEAERLVSNRPHTPEKWAKLGETSTRIASGISRLRYLCADAEEAGFILSSESPLRKAFQDWSGQIGTPAVVKLCRNEYEPVQVIIAAYDRALEEVEVSISPLKGPQGLILPPESLDVRIVDYVFTHNPIYIPDTTGWHPDPLMEYKPFSVPKGKIQPLWITVHVSDDIPAGKYRGEIVVKPSNTLAKALPIEVHVWDFTLPRETHLKTAFALFEGEIRAWYGNITDDMRRDYYQFLLDRRINPTNIYSRTPVPTKSDIPFCVQRGMNAFNLSYITDSNEETLKKTIENIREYESFLKKHGWWNKAYVYGFDEIQPPDYERLKQAYDIIKREFPDIPRMCTVVPNEELRGYVDIWVPITPNYNEKVASEYEASGDEVWWYICCGPHHPYANWFVDYSAVEPRIIFWMNWKYQVEGFLYYALNMWQSNRMVEGLPSYLQPHPDNEAREAIKAGKRWPEVPWNTFTYSRFNGDGLLIYPGPNGKPISSIRLECIRDGIEDYEYFYLLNSLCTQGQSAGIDSKLLSRAKKLLSVPEVKSLTEFSRDPETIALARERLGETIEAFQKALQIKAKP